MHQMLAHHASSVKECICCPRGYVAAIAVALLAATTDAHAQQKAPEGASGRTDKQSVTSRTFMVAAANPLAVDAGYEILRMGGTAVDAAIAVQLVLTSSNRRARASAAAPSCCSTMARAIG
jgi:hypothetical protein